METLQAIKIINECIAYKNEHGDFPVSKYNVINHYRKMAFEVIDTLLEYKPSQNRSVSFTKFCKVAHFDKNIDENLGFF